jgi:hypothetical protein
MATVHASLAVDLKGVDEQIAKDALRRAIESDLGGYIVFSPLREMVISFDGRAPKALRQTMTDALDGVGCELLDVTIHTEPT